MGKTYLTEAQRRDDEFRKLVKVGLASSGLDTQRELAKKIKMRESTLSAKLRHPDRFRRDELRLLVKALRIEPEAMGRVL